MRSQSITLVFVLPCPSAVSHLCEGTCRAVEFIGKGLCNVLDVAIGFLKVVETATRWVGKAINFILTALFRIHR